VLKVQHSHHSAFAAGIDHRFKIVLTFFSKEDDCELVRTCAPMDYGPSRRAKDGANRYHLWDYESDEQMHVLSLLPAQVVSIELTTWSFDPAEFVTWRPISWFYPRSWDAYSGTAAAA
jgi:hypothetical protein